MTGIRKRWTAVTAEARPGSRLDACFYLPFTRHSGMAPGSVDAFSSRELPRLPTLVRWFFSIPVFTQQRGT